jgi:hypothetical protein
MREDWRAEELEGKRVERGGMRNENYSFNFNCFISFISILLISSH